MASSAPSDPENSTLKRRARRRLIGSIALVLVAVIALPMIFDDEKKPLDQDVSVQIPNQEAVTARPADPKAGRGKVVEPKEPKSGETVARVDAPPAAPSTPSTQTQPATEAPAKEGAAKEGAAKEGAAKEGPKPKPEAKPDAKKEPKAEAKAALPKAEEARVKAILDGAMAKESAAKDTAASKESSAGFAVQIGAFATEDKIREAREKLGGAGFKSYTEKLDTKEGERTRVRAGPFSSRDAADAARDKIRALGFAGAAVVAK